MFWTASQRLFMLSPAVDTDSSALPPLPPLLSSQVSLRHKSKKKTRGGECPLPPLCALLYNLDPVWVCEKWQAN